MAYIQDWGMRVQAQPQINTTRRAFLHLSQNENGRMLNIRITDVNIPSGSTAVLAGTKPDGTVYSQAGTLAGNTATFAEDVQMTAVVGTWDAKITVTNGGNCICTARITITIDPDTVAGGAVPSDSQLDGIIAECRAIADSVRNEAYGSPLTAATAAAMTDQSRVYVYTGSETGYTSGHWYYYNGSAWTDGGVYNAVAVDTDTTLSISGKAADAKKTGDEISALKEDLTNVKGEVFTEESVWNEVTLEYESGKFWSLKGVNDTFSKAKRSTNLVPVTPGEILRITTRISTNIPGVVYFNSSTFSQSTFVGYDLYELEVGTTREYTDVEVTVPAGAAYVVLQGRPLTTPFALKKNSVEYVSRLDGIEESTEEYTSDNDFEVKNLERRVTNAESRNPFAWSAFDKSYFVFIHDDTNEYLETYANVFHTKGVPMGAATIPANITETHLATLQQIVADGGEVLGHYNASPTESSSDAAWMSCTGDVKKALEAYSFEVHGLIKANSTASSTNKGQKFCQRYYDYADNHLGKTEQFNFPRTLMLNYDSLSAFKARIDALENVNGIHAFGFHGGREDEAWITPEAFSEIIDYIQAKTNCEITTYNNLWQTFGSSVLAERIKALES